MNNEKKLHINMIRQIAEIEKLSERPDSLQEMLYWKKRFGVMMQMALNINRKDILDKVMELAEICYCRREDFSVDALLEIRNQYSVIYKTCLERDVSEGWDYIMNLGSSGKIKKKKSLCLIQQVGNIICNFRNNEQKTFTTIMSCADKLQPLWKEFLACVSPCMHTEEYFEDAAYIFLMLSIKEPILDYINYLDRHKDHIMKTEYISEILCTVWSRFAIQMDPLRGLFLLCKIAPWIEPALQGDSNSFMYSMRKNLKVFRVYTQMPEDWFDGDPEKTVERWVREYKSES